jgi:hypothetical protein
MPKRVVMTTGVLKTGLGSFLGNMAALFRRLVSRPPHIANGQACLTNRADMSSLPDDEAGGSMPTRITGLTKSQAEDLLDWLENTGSRQVQMWYTGDQGYIVQYR